MIQNLFIFSFKVKQFIIKISIFSVTILLSLTLLDNFYTKYVFSHKNLCEKSDWILNHHDENFDFAFIGNSRVLHMIDINVIEKKTRRKGINLGLRGANFSENYLVLDQFLKSSNKIKNLIVEVNMHNLNADKQLEYPFHDYNYIHLLKDSITREVFYDNEPNYKMFLWKYLPFVRYMEFSNHFSLYKILKGGFECKTSDDFDASKGSKIFNEKVFKTEKQNYVYWTFNENDKNYLNKIIDLAMNKNINLIFYTGPIYYKYLPFQLNYTKMIGEIKNNLLNKNISFFDFSNPQNNLCRDTADFSDNFHMNISGVAKLSLVVADSIMQLLK